MYLASLDFLCNVSNVNSKMQNNGDKLQKTSVITYKAWHVHVRHYEMQVKTYFSNGVTVEFL